jgi:hypothetical protein
MKLPNGKTIKILKKLPNYVPGQFDVECTDESEYHVQLMFELQSIWDSNFNN